MTPSIVEKWGIPVAERGFAQIPNYLLNLNQFLEQPQRLGSLELLLLIQLVSSWWKKNELPFPSMRTLATRCGASERQIQRTIKRLEELGLLARVKRGSGLMTSNAYNLQPLAVLLNKISEHFPNAHPRKLRGIQQQENSNNEPRAKRIFGSKNQPKKSRNSSNKSKD